MKKLALKTCLLLILLQASIITNAQTWDLVGNAATGSEKLGTTTAIDLNVYTNNLLRLTLKKDGILGLGTSSPRGIQEIFYCPNNQVSQNGFVVTKFNCASNNGSQNGGGTELPYPIDGGGQVLTDFVPPINYYTGNYSTVSTPLFGTNAPLLWARNEETNMGPSGNTFNSKFLVMPDGKTGINTANPRASIDILAPNFQNQAVAIFGAMALGTNKSLPNGLNQFYTKQIQVVPNLSENGFNRVSQLNDQGIFFSDGKGALGANLEGALVLAPWSNNNSPVVGGMRMDAFGNTEFHGSVRATKINVNAQWWSDFVFEKNYKLLSLLELQTFITEQKHLPNLPSEKEVLKNGIDIAEMQAKQLQKIEELTLYILNLQKQIDALSERIKENGDGK